MLRSLKELKGYSLKASDGELGEVRDFYFDDSVWMIRYLVADTSRWLTGRRVLLSPATLGTPSWESRTIPVSLTKDEVKRAPDVDTDRPISRQREIELARHYRWPEWWGVGGPVVPPLPPELDVARTKVVERAQDPHLRSLSEVIGYHAVAREEKIGKVDDLIADTEHWILRYFVVDTKTWRPGGEVLLAPDWVAHIDWEEHSLFTDLSAEGLRACPPYKASQGVNREYEQKLFDYHGRPQYWF